MILGGDSVTELPCLNGIVLFLASILVLHALLQVSSPSPEEPQQARHVLFIMDRERRNGIGEILGDQHRSGQAFPEKTLLLAYDRGLVPDDAFEELVCSRGLCTCEDAPVIMEEVRITATDNSELEAFCKMDCPEIAGTGHSPADDFEGIEPRDDIRWKVVALNTPADTLVEDEIAEGMRCGAEAGIPGGAVKDFRCREPDGQERTGLFFSLDMAAVEIDQVGECKEIDEDMGAVQGTDLNSGDDQGAR